MTSELLRKLSTAQKEARTNAAFVDLSYAFKMANPALGPDEVRGLIEQSYARRDMELEARVVSTSQFGDLVSRYILDKGD
jgi:hypothetical protein